VKFSKIAADISKTKLALKQSSHLQKERFWARCIKWSNQIRPKCNI